MKVADTLYKRYTVNLFRWLLLFVCTRFQVVFLSRSGVLFAFPSRFWFTFCRCRVFSLGGWSPHVQTGFHVSRPTCRKPSSTRLISHTGLSPSMAALSRAFYYQSCYILLTGPI